MAYAETTTVPVERSIAEIVAMVKKAGAARVMQFDEPDKFTITFEMNERHIRFMVPLPNIDDFAKSDARGRSRTNTQRIAARDQSHRQKARALFLVVKAKLESIESGVETFEQAFLANVVLSNGDTVYERIAAPVALEYQTGAPSQMLLSGPTGA